MQKTKVVLASILKPVDDTRMYEKIGISLDQTNKYDINIIGFSTKNTSLPQNIRWHQLGFFKRWSIGRLVAPWKVFKILLKVKPEIIVFNTPELLGVMTIYKIFFRQKIVYDVLENYRKNILHTNHYHVLIRPFLAYIVRSTERVTRFAVNHYFLAEKSYVAELGFARKKFTLLENKYKSVKGLVIAKRERKANINAIYSGTIAENYGIFDAIRLIDQLYIKNNSIRLTIIGYCIQQSVLVKLKATIVNKPYIELIGGEYPVPHQHILEFIAQSDVGICAYQENKSTDNCFPTKIYEYMANQLPILIRDNPYWTAVCKRYQACIITDFTQPDSDFILKSLAENDFYTNAAEMDIYWESEETKLLSAMDKMS